MALGASAVPAGPPPAAKSPARSAPKAVPLPKASTAVKHWMKTMTLRDEVAQLIFISFHGAAPHSRSREYRTFMRMIRDVKVGGLILVNWSNEIGRAHV